MDAHSLTEAGFRGRISPEEPLASYTTWRIGGPAELLAVPLDVDDLVVALRWARSRGLDWRVLGNGSNVLVREEGVRGIVLRLRRVLDELEVRGRRMHVGAGASFPAVARLAARRGLAGIEFGAGIPGTIGGAIVMNAGWHEHEIGARVSSVEFLHENGSTASFDHDACAFGYRRSVFRDLRGLVLSTELELAPGDPGEIRERLDFFAASRKANQPTELPSCGSVFLKPDGDFAGRLIEEAGLKGARVGDAQISAKHANFIVNLGEASSSDVLELVERAERAVAERSGVRLVREFEIW